MKRLAGKIAAVTGASQGIGLAIAREFASQGAHLALCSVDELADRAAQDLSKEFGVKTFGMKTDVSRHEECEIFIKRALEDLGGLDILVNNAGIARDNLAVRLDEAQWDLVLDVNLKGAFFMSKAALKHMMRNRGGRIINMSSVVGQMGNGGQSNYSASKSGLIGLTKSLAREFASRNVLINAIAPGFVETPMTAGIKDEARQKALASIPLGRGARPEDIAKAALFLASDDSAYITGQVLAVNGGMYM